jgi:class 3 adenylate cyclase
VPAHWAYEEAKAALDAAGRLIDVSLAERRNLVMRNPAPGTNCETTRTAIAERGVTAAPSPRHADGSLAGERRQVTILFADLCGFTTMSRTLDPEEVRELVGRYTALLDGIVVGYGGTVDKHIGDAVMALFGAPRAHDDDPMRAARAALDIHEALGRMSVTSTLPLQAHVGIAM